MEGDKVVMESSRMNTILAIALGKLEEKDLKRPLNEEEKKMLASMKKEIETKGKDIDWYIP